MRNAVIVAFLAALLGPLASVQAAEEAPKPDPRAALDALLKEVQESRDRETRANRQREARFLAAKADQQRLLKEAKAELARVERRSDQLKADYDANEKKLAELETVLNDRLGELGEMFGVVRLMAGDAKGQFESSLVSVQIPGREAFLGKLARSKALPSTAELERLWFEMLREAAEQGKVVRFTAPVVNTDGEERPRQVTRIGVFNVISEGEFLKYQDDIQRLTELPRQPGGDANSLASDFEQIQSGFAPMAIDPTRGQLMSLLIQTPSLWERLNQGGFVGWVIVVLGILGLALVAWRFAVLSAIGRKVAAQLKRPRPSRDNPLGRVMLTYQEDRNLDVETLGLKLDDAILKEMPQLERGLTAIKIVAAVAPLLGLLGTVVGMIVTFQAITLFGTGDPKLMADGISQALITTVLGLTVAIPLILVHGYLSGKSTALVQVLDEQSAGLVAEHAEKRSAASAA